MSPIHIPQFPDEKGCEYGGRAQTIPDWIRNESAHKTSGLPVCPNRNIQMVSRGICSFMSKALNQKHGRNADAVIVINTQDELFTMASDPELDPLDPHLTPLSVMTSKGDGQKLLDAIQKYSNDDEQVMGKIQLNAQPNLDEINDLSETDLPVRFPLVHATKALIQIFAEGGWGIQAAAVDNNWNLQLVRHQLG